LRGLGERLHGGCQSVAAGYDGGDEADFLIVAPAPPPGAPPALSAFLRGVGRRVLLFASLQAGDGPEVGAALSAAAARFAAEARELPMGHWPARFWKQVLAALPRASAGAAATPPVAAAGFEPLSALGAGARVPLLLALVAGLDEEDGAAALGVDAAVWRLALRRAAPHDADGRFDEAAWRALATASRDAQRALPDVRLAWWDLACQAALVAHATGNSVSPEIEGVATRRRRALRVLWAAVAACVLAFAATFVPWNTFRTNRDPAEPLAATGIPLAPPVSPSATYDDAFALRHHPDLSRLLAGDDALLRELGFGAWYAARLARDAAAASTRDGDAPAVPTEAPGGPVAAPANPFEPRMLPAPDAQSPAQRGELQRRIAAEDASPRAERGALRERWDAWQRMPEAERSGVRRALAAYAAMPADAQRALHEAFDAQPLDLQRGWLLGPMLGERWPRLQPLLQQVPASERDPLLARLHAMDAESLDALAVLAQRTPPQSREALRREMLGGRGG
jgi:hypothetical protein